MRTLFNPYKVELKLSGVERKREPPTHLEFDLVLLSQTWVMKSTNTLEDSRDVLVIHIVDDFQELVVRLRARESIWEFLHSRGGLRAAFPAGLYECLSVAVLAVFFLFSREFVVLLLDYFLYNVSAPCRIWDDRH